MDEWKDERGIMIGLFCLLIGFVIAVLLITYAPNLVGVYV